MATSSATVPSTEQPSILSRLPPLSTLGPLVALIAASIFFASQSNRFMTGPNWSLILQQVMVVGVLAIGQTLIILTGGVDLSLGTVMAFGTIVMTKFATENGVPAPLAVACGLFVTALFGFINGMLITRLKLPPFIVTLGTFNIAFALMQIYSRAQTVSGLPDFMTFWGNTFVIGGTKFTYGTVLMVVLFALAWYILKQTPRGRHVYAIGNNKEAARLVGIPTDRMLLLIYTIAGFLYGIAGWLLVARTGVGDPNSGQTENLETITAVVLGGTSLFGGRGSVVGTLIGAIIVGVFRNGLTLTGVPSIYQVLITGILVIVAVATDQLSRRKK